MPNIVDALHRLQIRTDAPSYEIHGSFEIDGVDQDFVQLVMDFIQYQLPFDIGSSIGPVYLTEISISRDYPSVWTTFAGQRFTTGMSSIHVEFRK